MLIKRIKNKILRTITKIHRNIKLIYTNTHYVSIGENCLTDNILSRHGLKSYSTIFSSARSNIDYAIHMEKDKYKNLLKNEFLYYEYVGKTKVVRNKYYSTSTDIFNDLHKNGFELTHHDVLSDITQRESAQRKINRLNKYRGRKNFKFFYHYRISQNNSLEEIFKKAEDFLNYYKINGRDCEFIIFTQKIVNHKNERHLEEIQHSSNVRAYVLYTLNIWEGDNNDIFWAQNDDDLIVKMLQNIRK